MAGLEQPSAGSVLVAGQEFAGLGEDELALARRRNIGIVFQAFHLIPTMTALENVAVPMELAGDADAFDRAAAELEHVGLGHRVTHYPGQLSGGEQQRVALARALGTGPRSCSPTSRPAISTARPVTRSSISCSNSGRSAAQR